MTFIKIFIGVKIKNTEKESKFGRMDQFMKVFGIMIRQMERGD